MKNFYLLLFCFGIFYNSSNSNPIYVPPSIYISELYFDYTQSNKWYLEVYIFSYNDLDSIKICSSKGVSSLNKLHFDNFYNAGFKVITVDSLISNLEINSLGDSITISYYDKHVNKTNSDILVFGNYRNSSVSKPPIGNSILRLFSQNPPFYIKQPTIYCKCNQPNLGSEEILGSISGNLKGRIFNHLNEPLKNINFTLNYDQFDKVFSKNSTDDNGNYSINVLASYNKIDSIFIYKYENSNYAEYCLLKHDLEFYIEPDSVINMNIYLTDIYVGFKNFNTSSNQGFHIFPNPVVSGNVINYETNLPIFSSNCIVDLISLDGKILMSQNIESERGTFFIPEKLKKGIYILNFKMNGKVCKTNHLIIK